MAYPAKTKKDRGQLAIDTFELVKGTGFNDAEALQFLAETTNVTPQTVANWTSRIHVPTGPRLVALAELYNSLRSPNMGVAQVVQRTEQTGGLHSTHMFFTKVGPKHANPERPQQTCFVPHGRKEKRPVPEQDITLLHGQHSGPGYWTGVLSGALVALLGGLFVLSLIYP